MTEIRAFDPGTLALIALLNPAVVAVAFMLGRHADQWQKVPVAAFAASIAGVVLYWTVVWLGLMPVHALGGEAGIFALQFLFGLAWAGAGYWSRGRAVH